MIEQNQFTWTTKSREKIYAYSWPVEEDAKAVICLVHGLGEHLHRYEHLAQYYNERGYIVMAFDNVGHGRSGGKRGHVSNYQIHMNNINELLQEAEKRYPLLPRFLYGHSMGGNFVLNYGLRNNPQIAGLITTGAFITLDKMPSPFLMGFVKLIRHILPALLQPNDLNPEHVSSDPEEVEKYMNDPLVHDKISTNAAVELFAAAEWLEKYSGHVDIPVLLMHATDDYLTSPNGSKLLANNLEGDVTLKEWEGMYHEVHNEPDQEEVFDYTIDWIEKKIEKWGLNTKES